jgi:hypothetical protein
MWIVSLSMSMLNDNKLGCVVSLMKWSTALAVGSTALPFTSLMVSAVKLTIVLALPTAREEVFMMTLKSCSVKVNETPVNG